MRLVSICGDKYLLSQISAKKIIVIFKNLALYVYPPVDANYMSHLQVSKIDRYCIQLSYINFFNKTNKTKIRRGFYLTVTATLLQD